MKYRLTFKSTKFLDSTFNYRLDVTIKIYVSRKLQTKVFEVAENCYELRNILSRKDVLGGNEFNFVHPQNRHYVVF